MSKPTALVTFLLDRSGSMESAKAATIEAFNAYLTGLQADNKVDYRFTFLTFDTRSLDKVHVDVPVNEAKPLTAETYQPRDGTPLIDAAMKTINATASALSKRADKPKVVVCIQTDGQENSSREYQLSQLQDAIKEKTREGWEFVFMGAGIDAYAQAHVYGFNVNNTVSYDKDDAVATLDSFMGVAANTAMYASGAVRSMAFSSEQKMAAGDKHWPPTVKAAPSATAKPAIVDDIDITQAVVSASFASSSDSSADAGGGGGGD